MAPLHLVVVLNRVGLARANLRRRALRLQPGRSDGSGMDGTISFHTSSSPQNTRSSGQSIWVPHPSRSCDGWDAYVCFVVIPVGNLLLSWPLLLFFRRRWGFSPTNYGQKEWALAWALCLPSGGQLGAPSSPRQFPRSTPRTSPLEPRTLNLEPRASHLAPCYSGSWTPQERQHHVHPRTRMPAEWEHTPPHGSRAHNPDDWPGKFRPIPWVFAEIVRHLSRVERVHILVNDLAAERRATSILRRGGANLARTHFHHWPTDRVWLRDSGPVLLKEPTAPSKIPAATSPSPTGSSTPGPSTRTGAATTRSPTASPALQHPEIQPEIDGHRLVLEGGSIDTNGSGVLLTTEECLLSEVQQRNPGSALRTRPAPSSNAPSAITSASTRPSGSLAAAPAMTPTATSTTSPAS